MNKTIIILLLFVSTICNAQIPSLNYKINEDTSFYANAFFNNFLGDMDTNRFLIGQCLLVSYDSIFVKGNNLYRVNIINHSNGKLEIYYRNKILYEFSLKNGIVSGVGYGYYLNNSTIALQGNFKNGKLDGFLFLFDKDGRVIECMKYVKGVFQKSIYYINAKSDKDLKIRNARRKTKNPLKNDEIIIMYDQ